MIMTDNTSLLSYVVRSAEIDYLVKYHLRNVSDVLEAIQLVFQEAV